MIRTYMPPGLSSLVEVDGSPAEYQPDVHSVTGLIGVSRQVVFEGATRGFASHSFELAAWRKVGQPVRVADLYVQRPVPEYGADYAADLPAGHVVEMACYLSVDETRAVLKEVLSVSAPDPEFALVAEQLAKPVVVRTPRFGDVTLDREYGWYVGRAKWVGREITLYLVCTSPAELDGRLVTAEKLWNSEADWQRRIERRVVANLLDTANTWAFDRGEPEVTAEQLIRRMEPESLFINDGGTFTFTHLDGDVFWGHSIDVEGDVESGITDALISG